MCVVMATTIFSINLPNISYVIGGDKVMIVCIDILSECFKKFSGCGFNLAGFFSVLLGCMFPTFLGQVKSRTKVPKISWLWRT